MLKQNITQGTEEMVQWIKLGPPNIQVNSRWVWQAPYNPSSWQMETGDFLEQAMGSGDPVWLYEAESAKKTSDINV